MSVNVKQNIQRILEQIDLLTKELYRLEGSLRVFQEFEKNGIVTVDIPPAATPNEEVQET